MLLMTSKQSWVEQMLSACHTNNWRMDLYRHRKLHCRNVHVDRRQRQWGCHSNGKRYGRCRHSKASEICAYPLPGTYDQTWCCSKEWRPPWISIKKIKLIVEHFHWITSSNEKLQSQQLQMALNRECVKPKKDVMTHSNTTYDRLQRLLQIQPAVEQSLCSTFSWTCWMNKNGNHGKK